MAIDFEALLRTFLAEAGENLSALEQNLLVLEREPADRERLDEVFRLVHTLKGDAGSLGFPILARFAHELEDHLERLRRGESQLSESQSTKLLEAVDALRDLLANAAAREEIERPEDRALLDALTAPPSTPSSTENEAASTPLAAARGVRTLSGTTGTNQTLRVPIERLDALLDLAGEMGIARRRLERSLADPNTARDAVVDLHREHERLQSTLEELVMALRLVPIGPTLERFERDVRDLAHAHGKRATLTIEGEATEVDTRVVERLRDPLLHMIRNAIDHGIESPAVRTAAGKPPSGTIHLAARREGASIAIEVSDDGRGLDRERILAKARVSGLVGAGEEPSDSEIDQLILLPGFSTAEEVSGFSGRGVGLDVVKKNVASLRGTVAIESRPGAGTVVTLRLPLTLARIEGFAVGVGNETYVVPLESVATILDLPSSAPRATETGLFEHEGQILPFVRLGRRFAAPERRHGGQRERVLVVERAAGRFGLVVDELRGQEPTVVKPLPPLFFGLPGLLGSTLLADGSVAFILDLESLGVLDGASLDPKGRFMKRNLGGICLAMFVLVLPAQITGAAELGEKLTIHGYGGWAVGASDPYPYLAGRGEGEAEVENVEAVLLLSARPTEKLRIVFAPEWEVEQEEGETEEETKIELAYAEWDQSDALRFQIGRSRMPFGIYTEIYDVGTLRPLYHLPQATYGHTGFVAEYYDGVGVGGTRVVRSDWDFTYDIYLGGASFDVDEPFEVALEGPGGDEDEEAEESEGNLESLLGFRMDFGSNVSGLSFGVSALGGEPESAGDAATSDSASWGDFASYGVHGELERGDWLIRSELGRHHEDEFDIDAGYLEVAYRFDENWQLAARYDHANASFEESLPENAESLLRHRESVVGLNDWFDPNFVVRLSFHRIDGNLFTHPEHDELFEQVENGTVDDSSSLILFGAQFSF